MKYRLKTCFSWRPLSRFFVIPYANVTNSLPKSSILNWKSLTVIKWCSCCPLSSKFKVNNHHIVTNKDIGEWVPNCPHSHNIFTSLFDKLLDLLGRLPFPISLRFSHFPSRTALDVENGNMIIISVNSSLHACKGIWLILVVVRFSYLSLKTLQNFVQNYWK